eukprot:COSAG02_NODE_2014_length_10107_cov_30.598821_1_plen_160_part_00
MGPSARPTVPIVGRAAERPPEGQATTQRRAGLPPPRRKRPNSSCSSGRAIARRCHRAEAPPYSGGMMTTRVSKLTPRVPETLKTQTPRVSKALVAKPGRFLSHTTLGRRKQVVAEQRCVVVEEAIRRPPFLLAGDEGTLTVTATGLLARENPSIAITRE